MGATSKYPVPVLIAVMVDDERAIGCAKAGVQDLKIFKSGTLHWIGQNRIKRYSSATTTVLNLGIAVPSAVHPDDLVGSNILPANVHRTNCDCLLWFRHVVVHTRRSAERLAVQRRARRTNGSLMLLRFPCGGIVRCNGLLASAL